ncbi:uncharacterized protein G2W53_038396 [Senna tora]|uniref:Uncharacterized protein n=1 Tax=Senna tora TaxID=362788 RepID=A0A834SNZ5_9FABA|nr:uncharacterized protein G2W53_038396 [Senna tora]
MRQKDGNLTKCEKTVILVRVLETTGKAGKDERKKLKKMKQCQEPSFYSSLGLGGTADKKD